nr:complexin-2 [Chrysemys picta bellii]
MFTPRREVCGRSQHSTGRGRPVAAGLAPEERGPRSLFPMCCPPPGAQRPGLSLPLQYGLKKKEEKEAEEKAAMEQPHPGGLRGRRRRGGGKHPGHGAQVPARAPPGHVQEGLGTCGQQESTRRLGAVPPMPPDPAWKQLTEQPTLSSWQA